MAEAYEALELAGKQPKWRLTLSPDAIRLEPPDPGEPIEVRRTERTARVELLNGVFLRRLLGVALAKKGKKLFRLDPAGYAALQAWAGPPTTEDLRKSLKRRFGWSVGLGALIILTSLPLRGDPEHGIPDLALNTVSLAMGIALISAGLMSRFMPSRIFFLVDCVWIAVAAWSTVDLLVDSFSVFNALILLFQANYILMSVREFRHFGALQDAVAPPSAP